MINVRVFVASVVAVGVVAVSSPAFGASALSMATVEKVEVYQPAIWTLSASGGYSGGVAYQTSTSARPFPISRSGPARVMVYGTKSSGCQLRYRFGSGSWTTSDVCAGSLEHQVLFVDVEFPEGAQMFEIERTAGTLILDFYTYESLVEPEPPPEPEVLTPQHLDDFEVIFAVAASIVVFLLATHVIGHSLDA